MLRFAFLNLLLVCTLSVEAQIEHRFLGFVNQFFVEYKSGRTQWIMERYADRSEYNDNQKALCRHLDERAPSTQVGDIMDLIRIDCRKAYHKNIAGDNLGAIREEVLKYRNSWKLDSIMLSKSSREPIFYRYEIAFSDNGRQYIMNIGDLFLNKNDEIRISGLISFIAVE